MARQPSENNSNYRRETTVVYADDGTPLIEKLHVELIVSEGLDLDKRAVLEDEPLVIGTHAQSDFVLTDNSISRKHVELRLAPAGIHVRDLGSTNGTYVGHNRIAEGIVPIGSTLTVGETRIEMRRSRELVPIPLSRRRRFGNMIGSSGPMRQAYALLERAAAVDMTVLIEGETGTGKELASQAIHENSRRASGPFVVVDCGAVSPNLIEAELFGHERGAFTGADRERPGAFEQADQGTLFFDEIGELPLNLQPKLLRALESREVQRIGSTTKTAIDARFIAATNRNLTKEVKKGTFRSDLYYRLNVFKITLPPLRERRDDIPGLIKHFLGPFGGASLPQEIIDRMVQLDWKGNVRELKNAVERAVVLARDDLRKDDGENTSSPVTSSMGDFTLDVSRPFKELKAEIVDAFERKYIIEVLKANSGNISASARQSGIDRKHLERLIRKHDINVRSSK